MTLPPDSRARLAGRDFSAASHYRGAKRWCRSRTLLIAAGTTELGAVGPFGAAPSHTDTRNRSRLAAGEVRHDRSWRSTDPTASLLGHAHRGCVMRGDGVSPGG